MIKTILFDLDDTLLDFHRSETVAIGNTLRHFGIEPTAAVIARYSAINLAHWERLERGEITRSQVQAGRFAVLFEELGVDRSPEEVHLFYQHQLSLQHFFLPGAKELLDQLKNFYTLVIISNGTATVQDRRIRDAGLLPYFSHIFISQRLGYDKPSAAFFDACFAAMPGVNREECLIVGDSLTSDMLGGRNAGIPTCWYNPRGKLRRTDIPVDYELRRLEELPELLERWNKE